MGADRAGTEREAGAEPLGSAVCATALIVVPFLFGVYVIVAALTG
jgi:hypothetical protein